VAAHATPGLLTATIAKVPPALLEVQVIWLASSCTGSGAIDSDIESASAA
jgi:hypothetical protein